MSDDYTAETCFLDRGEQVANRLEVLAQDIRRMLAHDYPAADRACDIVHAIQWGVANLPLQTLIKRAVLADKERDNA